MTIVRIDQSGIKAALAADSDDTARPCLAGHPDRWDEWPPGHYDDEAPELDFGLEWEPEPDDGEEVGRG